MCLRMGWGSISLKEKSELRVLLCLYLSITDNCASVADNNTSLTYQEAAFSGVDNFYWVFPKFIRKNCVSLQHFIEFLFWL